MPDSNLNPNDYPGGWRAFGVYLVKNKPKSKGIPRGYPECSVDNFVCKDRIFGIVLS